MCRGEALSVVVRTSRGDVSASLPADIDPPVFTQFAVSPSEISVGQEATLSWETQDATHVSIDNGVGTKGVSGNHKITPTAPGTITYTATAAGRGGQDSKSVRLFVKDVPKFINRRQIWFRTGNENKDPNTKVFVEVFEQDGRKRQFFEWHQTTDEEFKKNSANGKGFTENHLMTVEDLKGAYLRIKIDPVGNDTWTFGYVIFMDVSDGSEYRFVQDGITLSERENNRVYGPFKMPSR